MMSSKRTNPPHPWHEGQPFGLPQNVDKMERRNAFVNSPNSSNHRSKQRSSASRRRSSRLWQLPEESIQGYVQWIQDKPEADQTPGERRFLWKYMMRHFSVRQSSESTRSFVENLERKPNRTALEDAFIKQYYQRKKERRNERKCVLPASVVNDEAVIAWERPPARDSKQTKKSVSFFPRTSTVPASTSASNGPTMTLSGLQESMAKLGLSISNLKDAESKDDVSIEMSL